MPLDVAVNPNVAVAFVMVRDEAVNVRVDALGIVVSVKLPDCVTVPFQE